MHYLVKRGAQKSHLLVTRQNTSKICVQIEKNIGDIPQLGYFDFAVNILLEMILVNIGIKRIKG
jgi:hypothetical protein